MPVSIDYQPVGKPYCRPSDNAWIITRYEDAIGALRAPNVSVAAGASTLAARVSDRMGGSFENLAALVGSLPILQNPPEHGPSRDFLHVIIREMSKAYSYARIDRAASRLFERSAGEIDGMTELCYDLPDGLLGESLGFSRDELRDLRLAGRQVLEDWQPAMPLREYERRQSLSLYVHDRLTERWASHGCPILGGKARLDEIDLSLPARQRESAVFFLIAIANETIAAFFGNVLHLLANRPDLQDMLRGKPEVASAFVEEALRFCGSIRQRSRVVGEGGLRLGDTMIPEGALVHVVIESANHDPEAYPDPDRFDIARRGPPTLAFGAGSHLCVGAVFARRQARRFLTVLLQRYSILPGEAPARLMEQQEIRQFATLPLRLQPRQREN
ncbi:MAG: cytochrome P450 [Methylocystis sp.]|uniref:cytochrome P450 n=1 Tax=Methylocystis sp. TaxID=1911079 RepID=UPI003929F672